MKTLPDRRPILPIGAPRHTTSLDATAARFAIEEFSTTTIRISKMA
jgi:hypothetical protein